VSGFKDLPGKVAVVTGGASGIGLGIARQFRAAGMQVVIADIEDGALQRAATEIGALGVRTDVRDAGSVQALADATLAEHGAVHVVVNNAGVGPMAPIADLQLADWQWMLQVNLWGVINGVHTFLPLLRQNAQGGHIVNTASIGGLVPGPGLGAYNVSKYGIVALTEVLAMELAAEDSLVGASVLVPGTVRTGIGNSTRNRPTDATGGALSDVDLEAGPDLGMKWLEPDDVGRILIESIAAGDLYVVTHPEGWPMVAARHQAIADAFGAAAAARG
jgi:NAD(P)-dependent dehydrogenase (short-subunit alcohol dehydrogenase family)